MLDAWREQGADRVDPVRFHLIDALERRAASHDGAVRRMLDERLAALIADYARTLAHSRAPAQAASPAEPARGPLAALVDHIARHASAHAGRTYPEVGMLDDFREIWSKLSTERQLRQSLDQVPRNAGPLNSSSLVHRALSQMRELSPDYLRQFLSYVDTLSWLDQMVGDGAPAADETPRAKGTKGVKGAKGAKKGSRALTAR
nr:DUF2894 domain-containing protein [Burkholderia guangdongensis]